ncbi:MAG: undecaprenyldiphospho-muramoylpentapeptide beta-N-acetylglucosaminyltransferase [Candidatus Omnitrophota bacterium]
MKVLVATGSSGGHIFPALSFLAALKKKSPGVDALLVLPKKSIKSVILPAEIKVKYTSTSAIGLGLSLKNLRALINLFKGFLESLLILCEFRPDVVAGFGGLNSVPLVLLGWLFRAKTIIHEQNVIPGRANRLLAKFSDRIAVSFKETENFLRLSRDKVIISGNPIREELRPVDKSEALRFFGFENNKFTILVMGGSQGSRKINATFPKAAALLSDISGFQVIHISGAENLDLLSCQYTSLGIKFKLFNFLPQMQYAYSAADLAISRAGATTVAELILYRLPAIIVPYPFAYRHQEANAGFLQDKKAAVKISDDALEAGALAEAIGAISMDPQRRMGMSLAYEGIVLPDANNVLADAALSLISINE